MPTVELNATNDDPQPVKNWRAYEKLIRMATLLDKIERHLSIGSNTELNDQDV